MMDMKVFWILVGAIAVAIEIIDRLRDNRETCEEIVERRCQWLADAISIDRRHVFINDRNEIDITPEGLKQHRRNLGLRVVSEEENEYVGYTTYETIDDGGNDRREG